MNNHKPIHANVFTQNSNDSVITKEGLYDFDNFSEAEIRTIIAVLRTAYSDKYHKTLRGVGLVNELNTIVYKPRYILLDMTVKLFEKSHSPFDSLAVAEAYRGKGAAYRTQAIEHYEYFLKKASKGQRQIIRDQFIGLADIFLYNNLSNLYEGEHNLYRALKYAEMAESLNIDNLPAYPIHIARILLKINPEKAVSYLTNIMNRERYQRSKSIIENTVKELEQKRLSGYRYKPRSSQAKQTDIDAHIAKATLDFLPGGKYYSLWAE